MSVKVIKKFPDTSDFSYNYAEWNRQFLEQNVILNGRYSNIYYPSHWTPLSVKFAFGGNEHYIFDRMKYSVDDSSYLILNRDTVYESLIDSDKSVESFTLNFTPDFADEVFYSHLILMNIYSITRNSGTGSPENSSKNLPAGQKTKPFSKMETLKHRMIETGHLMNYSL